MKKVLALVMTALLAVGLLAGCGSSGGETTTEGGGETGSGFLIGSNYFGPGSYALNTLLENQEYVVECVGSTNQDASDDFQVDKIVQDIENLISAGCDGLIIWLPADNLYSTVIEKCEEAQVPFVFSDKVPSDESVIAQLQACEYFAGAVGPANAEYGTIEAEYALAQGWKTCMIETGSQGDPTDTPRIEAFTAAFTAGGGEVVADVIYCDSQDKIQPNASDALTAHPDVDFIYGTGSDYAIGSADAITAKGNTKTKVITSGLDSAVLEYLVDDSNPVVYVNGDYWISGTMAAVALMNFLNGNPLKDADGNMVFIDDIMPFDVTADNYEIFKATFIDNHCYSKEEINAMIGITYDEFCAVIENYSLEERAAAAAAQ